MIRWKLVTEDGSTFLGECVPVQYVTGETPESVLAVVPKMEALIRGRAISEMDEIMDDLAMAFPSDVAARTGIEIGLYSAHAAESGISVHRQLGGAGVTVETDLTISRIPNSAEVAREAAKQGFRIFKIKVGGDSMEEDIDRILGIVNTVPEAIIRLDANQALTVESTLQLAERLLRSGVNLELIEQPVPKEDLSALDEVSRLSSVPIIADEARCSPLDAIRLFSETAVQGVNVKLMKSGVRGALDIIRIAKKAGKKLMIGCMLESEIGMAASVGLACGTGVFDYIDLDGHLLLDLEKPITLFRAEGPYLSAIVG